MPLTDIPPTLPKAVLAYINRANELENVDPLISYFSKLYAVEKILNEGLHTSDDSISHFAIKLLDEIESIKTNSDAEFLDIINDKDLSIAYILSFANKIFNSSLQQIQNHKSSKSTALNFLASVNFYDLLRLWKDNYNSVEESEELIKKIKYAKFHATRIIKTLKKGEDPNDYDPPKLEIKGNLDDSNEVDELLKSQAEEIEAQESNNNEFNLPQTPSSEPEAFSEDPNPPEFIDDEVNETHEDNFKGSQVFDADDKEDDLKLPEPPKFNPTKDEDIPTIDDDGPSSLNLPDTPKSKPSIPQSKPIVKHHTASPVKEEKINVEEILETTEIYSKAQKHAKFAISAMNYEDKETAIKELNDAIELLGKLSY